MGLLNVLVSIFIIVCIEITEVIYLLGSVHTVSCDS